MSLTALDVTVQTKILGSNEKLSGEYGTSIIFISHDRRNKENVYKGSCNVFRKGSGDRKY